MTVIITAYEKVTSRLVALTGYQPMRDGADWKCPAHVDNKSSLTVTRKGNRVLLHCHAGCELSAVLQAMGLQARDLFDGPAKNNDDNEIGEWTPRGRAIAVYSYVDENGYTLYEVCRTADKEFPLRVPDPSAKSGFRWRLDGTRKVIYRLPKVIDAVKNGFAVWIVEGEKDVHSMEAQGEVATTNPGGAEKWRPEFASWFDGANVFIVADKDAPGRVHAQRVADSLEGHATNVTIVEAAEGKDATDHFAHGYNVEQFVKVRGDEPFIEPESTWQSGRPFVPMVLDLNSKPEPREVIAPFLYRGGLTILQAEPGVGKTWLALWRAVDFMRAGGTILYFDEEGGEELAKERLYALGATNDLIANRLFYFPFEARKWTADDLREFEVLISNIDGPCVAVFDSLPDFLAAAGLNEDKAPEVTTFINTVFLPLKKAGISQLVLDHMRKPEPGKQKSERSRYARGSSAKLAKADATILVETAEPFDANRSGRLRVFKTKDRYGRLPLPRLDGEPGLLINVTVNANGDVRMSQVIPSSEDVDYVMPHAECREAIVRLFQQGNDELTSSQIAKVIPFHKKTIGEALQHMVQARQLLFRTGPRNSVVYRVWNGDGLFDDMEDEDE